MRLSRLDHRVQGGHSDEGFTLVELLVVVVLVALVGVATMSVLISTSRAQTFTSELRTVMDDGRTSLDRIRAELRGAREVSEATSNRSSLHFWLDQNQNSLRETSELICYRTELVPGSSDRWRLMKYSDVTSDCSSASLTGGQIIAQTLRSDQVFFYEPDDLPFDTTDSTTPKVVRVQFVLDVKTSGTRGPEQLELDAVIRLRNVA